MLQLNTLENKMDFLAYTELFNVEPEPNNVQPLEPLNKKTYQSVFFRYEQCRNTLTSLVNPFLYMLDVTVRISIAVSLSLMHALVAVFNSKLTPTPAELPMNVKDDDYCDLLNFVAN